MTEQFAADRTPADRAVADRTAADTASAPVRSWARLMGAHEEQVFLALTLLIGALVGAAVVAFILLTERVGLRLYPVGGAPWRRFFIPVLGSLALGYLLYRYFPDARGSGVPQTKAALFARGGRITLGTVFGKFFCTSATLACGIPLGREGPAVQVGAGIASRSLSSFSQRAGMSQVASVGPSMRTMRCGLSCGGCSRFWPYWPMSMMVGTDASRAMPRNVLRQA